MCPVSVPISKYLLVPLTFSLFFLYSLPLYITSLSLPLLPPLSPSPTGIGCHSSTSPRRAGDFPRPRTVWHHSWPGETSHPTDSGTGQVMWPLHYYIITNTWSIHRGGWPRLIIHKYVVTFSGCGFGTVAESQVFEARLACVVRNCRDKHKVWTFSTSSELE